VEKFATSPVTAGLSTVDHRCAVSRSACLDADLGQNAAARCSSTRTKPPMSGKLKLPEYFFQLLVEASADALLVMDAKGSIVFANAQAGHIFGYRPDDLLNKPMKLLIPDDLHKRHASNGKRSASPRARR